MRVAGVQLGDKAMVRPGGGIVAEELPVAFFQRMRDQHSGAGSSADRGSSQRDSERDPGHFHNIVSLDAARDHNITIPPLLRNPEDFQRDFDTDEREDRAVSIAANSRAPAKDHEGQNVKRTMLSDVEKEVLFDELFDIFAEEFPNADLAKVIAVGSFTRGALIFSLEDPNMVLRVAPGNHRVSAWVLGSDEDGRDVVIGVKFEGKVGRQHVETTLLRSEDAALIEANQNLVSHLRRRGVTLQELYERDRRILENGGSFNDTVLRKNFEVGGELECWGMDPLTGNLIDEDGDEYVRGLLEIDEGVYVDGVKAAKGMARRFLALHDRIKSKHPDAMIVRTGFPICGDPRANRINADTSTDLGRYMSAKEYATRPHFQTVGKSKQVRDQQTEKMGVDGGLEGLKTVMGDSAARSNAASQLNAGWTHVQDPETGEYYANAAGAEGLSALVFSELGSWMSLMAVTGSSAAANTNGIDITINGRFTRSIRHHTRREIMSAEIPNIRNRGPWHRLAMLYATSVCDPDKLEDRRFLADRIDRAFAPHRLPNGQIIATAHSGRMRVKKTGRPSGMTEECNSETSTICIQVRKMGHMQMFQAIEEAALEQGGLDPFEFLEKVTGYSQNVLFGQHFKTVDDFVNRVSDSRAKQLRQRLEVIFRAIVSEFPVMREAYNRAMAGLKYALVDADFTQLSYGRGTVDSAMSHLRSKGYTGRERAYVYYLWSLAEAQYVDGASDQQVANYNEGKGGFGFRIPTRKEIQAIFLAIEKRREKARKQEDRVLAATGTESGRGQSFH